MKTIFIFATLLFVVQLGNAQSRLTFTWVPWKNVSSSTKAALKKVKEFKDETAYDAIIEDIQEGCDIEVAVLDMDGDGKLEYAVGSEGRFCCGTHGCSLTVYTLGGHKRIDLTDQWRYVKPDKNGVITSTGLLTKFYTPKRN
jgi:hypothetical protein